MIHVAGRPNAGSRVGVPSSFAGAGPPPGAIALVERSLHDNVNEFFTRPWQDDIRSAESKNHMDKLYLEKFGADDYEHIKKVREWMKDHPRKGMLIAYLQASDPYKV